MGRLLHTGGQVSWLAAHRPADAFPFPVASLSAVSPLTVTSSPGIFTRFPFHRTQSARHPTAHSVFSWIILQDFPIIKPSQRYSIPSAR